MALASENEATVTYEEGSKMINQTSTGQAKYSKTGSASKEAELRKTIENYEEHHSSLSRANRKLEEQNNELENKIFNLETEYKNRLSEKDIELKELKSAAR